jgi:hypothetical protein
LEEEEAARADAQVLTMSRPDTGEQVLACTMRRGEAKRGELIAVAEPGGNAWAQGSGVRWQGGCECEQCRQTVTRAGYIIQSTAGLLGLGRVRRGCTSCLQLYY